MKNEMLFCCIGKANGQINILKNAAQIVMSLNQAQLQDLLINNKSIIRI